jgi:hypothetical protein
MTREFDTINHESHNPEEFWGYASGGKEYAKPPEVIIAEHMQQKGVGISVRSEEDRPGDVSIYASQEGKTKLDAIVKPPEVSAIFAALAGNIRPPKVPDVERCEWDVPTKQRVQALYWRNRWQFSQHILDSTLAIWEGSPCRSGKGGPALCRNEVKSGGAADIAKFHSLLYPLQ